MNEETSSQKKQISLDWFVQGILTRLGDAFDRLLGRGWKPSSSLATSELIERMKRLVDAEARESTDNRKFVPHNIKLRMQWDKFSTDSDELSRKLENELLTALVDHINDRRYYTYAPITLEVKPDYFTNGIKLFAGFERPDENDGEAAINIPQADSANASTRAGSTPVVSVREKVIVRFAVQGIPVQKELAFEEKTRLTLGRTKENDLTVDDVSVSKMHASLLLNAQRQFVVADTGSTNGTFVDGERISYGKAVAFSEDQKLKLGDVELTFQIDQKPPDAVFVPAETDAVRIGEFEFSGRTENMSPATLESPAATISSIPGIAGVANGGERKSEPNGAEDEKQI